MISSIRQSTLSILFVFGFVCLLTAEGFVANKPIAFTQGTTAAPTSSSSLKVSTAFFTTLEDVVTTSSASLSTSSFHVAAETFDPTAVLSDLLGGLLGTPAILAVPVVAALGVASLFAAFIVNYANPEVEED